MPIEIDSFNIKICKELNDLCELQTQCVLYVVFTRQSSEALKYIHSLTSINPLTSKDLGIKIK
jgi:hypothetical protein